MLKAPSVSNLDVIEHTTVYLIILAYSPFLSVCIFFFTPLDAARIISPGLAHHSFPFVSPLRLRFRLFCLFIPCTTSTFTGIDSTLTCC
jgi:hypothetical protein